MVWQQTRRYQPPLLGSSWSTAEGEESRSLGFRQNLRPFFLFVSKHWYMLWPVRCWYSCKAQCQTRYNGAVSILVYVLRVLLEDSEGTPGNSGCTELLDLHDVNNYYGHIRGYCIVNSEIPSAQWQMECFTRPASTAPIIHVCIAFCKHIAFMSVNVHNQYSKGMLDTRAAIMCPHNTFSL